MEELISMLKIIGPLSGPLEEHLRLTIKQLCYRKGAYLLKRGEIGNHILYLREGLVRSFRMIGRKNMSKWFMKEGDICISIQSFFGRMESEDSIVALEKCECWGITHDELEQTYKLFPEFNFHGRIITSRYYVLSELRNDAILGRSPQDKYAQLMEENPDLLRRVRNSHLASFLNVSLRTFYEIRKKYAEKKRKTR